MLAHDNPSSRQRGLAEPEQPSGLTGKSFLLAPALLVLVGCENEAPREPGAFARAPARATSASSTSQTYPIMRVRPPGTPPPVITDTPHLSYAGGSVISSVVVVAVFWGTKVNDTVTKQIPGFYTALTTSYVMDWLAEYDTTITSKSGAPGTNQLISRGSFDRSVTIMPANANVNLSDDDIRTELSSQLDKGNLPAATDNSLYMVHFPAGVTITAGTTRSCVPDAAHPEAFCAYHWSYTHNGQRIRYGVMPDLSDPGCSTGCGASTQFNNQTTASSHELIEAITDPDSSGWVDANLKEIGDLCNQQQDALPGTDYTVQKQWSNLDGACLINSDIAADGEYKPLYSGVGGSLCLDVPDGSTTPGTQVQIFPCNQGPNQQWVHILSTKELRSPLFANLCLDVSGGSTRPGAKVQVYPCNGTAAQKWVSSASGQLVSALSADLCLDVTGGSAMPGTKVETWTCNGAAAQQWFTVLHSAVGANLCLDVPSGSTTPGTHIQTYPCHNGPNQEWIYVPATAELRTALAPTVCVAVPGGFTPPPGTQIELAPCNGGYNQQWVRLPSGQIVTPLSAGLCLDVPDGSTMPGRLIQIYSCHSGSNQQWF
jgi:hypothetical protein